MHPEEFLRAMREWAFGPAHPADGRLTDRAARVLELARDEAGALGHDYLAPEHILLGILREGENLAYRGLSLYGYPEDIRKTVLSLISGR